MKEINVGDKFGQWLVTEVEEHSNGEDSVLLEDTKGGFGGFWIPVYLLQTLVPHHERFAEIVRRFSEWHDQDDDTIDILPIVTDAAALWEEYQEQPK